MNRRQLAAVVLLPAAGLVTGSLALIGGMAVPDALAGAVCVVLAGAGVMLAGGETIRWSAAAGPERTSAGWHEVRLLAETLSSAGTDPAARRRLNERIGAALPGDGTGAGATADPERSAGVTRRQYEAALTRLRRTGP